MEEGSENVGEQNLQKWHLKVDGECQIPLLQDDNHPLERKGRLRTTCSRTISQAHKHVIHVTSGSSSSSSSTAKASPKRARNVGGTPRQSRGNSAPEQRKISFNSCTLVLMECDEMHTTLSARRSHHHPWRDTRRAARQLSSRPIEQPTLIRALTSAAWTPLITRPRTPIAQIKKRNPKP